MLATRLVLINRGPLIQNRFIEWVSVWVVGIRPLMDIRHKGAVSTQQGDHQFTTASRSHFPWLLQAAVCFMPHESDAVTVSGRFA